jgi:hypothetical protein
METVQRKTSLLPEDGIEICYPDCNSYSTYPFTNSDAIRIRAPCPVLWHKRIQWMQLGMSVYWIRKKWLRAPTHLHKGTGKEMDKDIVTLWFKKLSMAQACDKQVLKMTRPQLNALQGPKDRPWILRTLKNILHRGNKSESHATDSRSEVYKE